METIKTNHFYLSKFMFAAITLTIWACSSSTTTLSSHSIRRAETDMARQAGSICINVEVCGTFFQSREVKEINLNSRNSLESWIVSLIQSHTNAVSVQRDEEECRSNLYIRIKSKPIRACYSDMGRTVGCEYTGIDLSGVIELKLQGKGTIYSESFAHKVDPPLSLSYFGSPIVTKPTLINYSIPFWQALQYAGFGDKLSRLLGDIYGPEALIKFLGLKEEISIYPNNKYSFINTLEEMDANPDFKLQQVIIDSLISENKLQRIGALYVLMNSKAIRLKYLSTKEPLMIQALIQCAGEWELKFEAKHLLEEMGCLSSADKLHDSGVILSDECADIVAKKRSNGIKN